MTDDIKTERVTINIHCSNHSLSDRYENKETYLIYKESFDYEYKGALNSDDLNVEVYRRAPKNIRCEKCKSTEHNLLSYIFIYVENLKSK